MEAGYLYALVSDNTELAATRLDEATALLPNDPEINLLSLQLQNRYRAERLLKSTGFAYQSWAQRFTQCGGCDSVIPGNLRLAPSHPGAIAGFD